MKIAAVPFNNKSDFITVKHRVSRSRQCSTVSTPSFKGNAGILGGFCFCGVAGYASSIGIALLGAPVNLFTFLVLFLGGCIGGSYCGNKLENKIDKKIDELAKKQFPNNNQPN